MAEQRKLGVGSRILQSMVFAGLLLMTAAAAYQTWKQAMLPDFRTSSPETFSLDWSLLRDLDFKTGKAPEALRHFDCERVRIPGFVVPFEDKEDKILEFLLVPYVGACIHTPPPPANQIVHVRMSDMKAVGVNVSDPVWVVGELHISPIKSQYGEVSFQIRAHSVEP